MPSAGRPPHPAKTVAGRGSGRSKRSTKTIPTGAAAARPITVSAGFKRPGGAAGGSPASRPPARSRPSSRAMARWWFSAAFPRTRCAPPQLPAHVGDLLPDAGPYPGWLAGAMPTSGRPDLAERAPQQGGRCLKMSGSKGPASSPPESSTPAESRTAPAGWCGAAGPAKRRPTPLPRTTRPATCFMPAAVPTACRILDPER